MRTAQQGDGDALVVTFVSVPREEANPRPDVTVPAPPSSESPRERFATIPSQSIIPDHDPNIARTLSKIGDEVTTSDTLAASSPSSPPTSSATDPSNAQSGSPSSDLLASYHAALRARIVMTWHGLTDRAFPSGCALLLAQRTGGAVTATSANDCTLREEDRLQLEAAALMAQPLPYVGFEPVFETQMRLEL